MDIPKEFALKKFILPFLMPFFVFSEGGVREVAHHTYPIEMEAKGLVWRLSGVDHFRFRLFSVFTGALYSSAASPKARRLVFTYTRNLEADTLVEQGMRVLRTAKPEAEIEARQPLIDTVNAAYRDVSRGDRYIFTVIPDRGTWLHLNEEEILFVGDADFGLWYLDIWLGDDPMSVSLRNALLEGIGKD